LRIGNSKNQCTRTNRRQRDRNEKVIKSRRGKHQKELNIEGFGERDNTPAPAKHSASKEGGCKKVEVGPWELTLKKAGVSRP